MHHTVFIAIELHEHQVPNLDVAVTIFIRRSRWATRDARAVVVENLRTRAARASIAHGPEVIRLILARTGFVADAR